MIVVRADEIRNGYALSGPDFYRQTPLPSGSPFTLSEAVDGGQLIADVAMVLQAENVTNTGYLASGGLLSIDADSLWNGHRNAYYHEVRKVKGGKLIIDGDTVQPGGALAGGSLDFQVGSVSSHSGEFIVMKDTPEATQAASSAFVAALAAELGEDYQYSEAEDHLTTQFKAKKKKSGLGTLLATVAVSYFTFGAASALLAEGAVAGSTWAAKGLANTVISQSLASVASSAAGQLVGTGDIDWGTAFTAGLTGGITSGLTEFNVGSTGVVLNNATAATASVLAGPLAANPKLGGTPAQVILNEVTGSAASLLAGPLEIGKGVVVI